MIEEKNGKQIIFLAFRRGIPYMLSYELTDERRWLSVNATHGQFNYGFAPSGSARRSRRRETGGQHQPMNSPNFVTDHGAVLLWPVAAAAVGFALLLVIDGIRGWRKRRQIAKLCAERRRAAANFSPIIAPSSTSGPPAGDYVSTTCQHCAGHLVVPTSLRFTEMACPNCTGTVYLQDAKPVTFERSARPNVLAVGT